MWTNKFRSGFSVVELLVVVAIIGILSAVGYSLLPRQGIAVTQGGRVLAAAVQYARFEAIRLNREVELVVAVDSAELNVVVPAFSGSGRAFPLDPQGSAVVVKGLLETTAAGGSSVASALMRFNPRGVLLPPVAREVTLGIRGPSESWNQVFLVSGQGASRVDR